MGPNTLMVWVAHQIGESTYFHPLAHANIAVCIHWLKHCQRVLLFSRNQGWWNRSGRPGDRWTNICWMVPEKRTDVISQRCYGNFPIFSHFNCSTILYIMTSCICRPSIHTPPLLFRCASNLVCLLLKLKRLKLVGLFPRPNVATHNFRLKLPMKAQN